MVFYDFNHNFNDFFCLSLSMLNLVVESCYKIWHSWIPPPWCTVSPWFLCATPPKVSIHLRGSSFCFFCSFTLLTQTSQWWCDPGVSLGPHLYSYICPLRNHIQPKGSIYLYVQMISKFIASKFHIHISNYLGNIKNIPLGMNRHQYIPYKNRDHLLSPTNFLQVKDISILLAA